MTRNRINAGDFNRRIKIFKRATGYDEYGEPLDTKELVYECWSSVRNKSGKEQFEVNTPFSKAVTSFLIRHTRTFIDTTMTIEFQGDFYNIIYFDNYNFSNEYIELTAEKVV